MIVTLSQPVDSGLGSLAFGVPTALVSRAADVIRTSGEGKAAQLYSKLNPVTPATASEPASRTGSSDSKGLLIGLGIGAGILFALNLAGGTR